MKSLFWIVFSKYNRLLSGATIAISVAVVAAGGFFGAKIFVLSPSNSLIEKNLASQRKQLAMAERDNTDFKGQKLPKTAKVLGRKVIDHLQQLSEAEAASAGCTLDQFSAPALAAAYTPHYGTGAGDYSAFHVRMTVSGNLGRVFEMLQSLSDGPVPFELTSLALSPNGKSGDETTASVEMDVLSKPEAT
jgi:hypothetical protein